MVSHLELYGPALTTGSEKPTGPSSRSHPWRDRTHAWSDYIRSRMGQ